MDSWSPHTVARDRRLPQLGPHKVLAGMDFVDMPADIVAELPKLIAHIPLLATMLLRGK